MLHVGDIVEIIGGDSTDYLYFSTDMSEYIGREAEIVDEVFDDDEDAPENGPSYYHINIDGKNWCWLEEWLKPLATEDENELRPAEDEEIAGLLGLLGGDFDDRSW